MVASVSRIFHAEIHGSPDGCLPKKTQNGSSTWTPKVRTVPNRVKVQLFYTGLASCRNFAATSLNGWCGHVGPTLTTQIFVGGMYVIMYVCIYVCIYVCMYVCMYVHICIDMYVYVSIYIHVYMCSYVVCRHYTHAGPESRNATAKALKILEHGLLPTAANRQVVEPVSKSA